MSLMNDVLLLVSRFPEKTNDELAALPGATMSLDEIGRTTEMLYQACAIEKVTYSDDDRVRWQVVPQ